MFLGIEGGEWWGTAWGEYKRELVDGQIEGEFYMIALAEVARPFLPHSMATSSQCGGRTTPVVRIASRRVWCAS